LSVATIRTATLAEIYARQGHLAEACAIYQELAAQRPDEAALTERLAALRERQRLESLSEGRRGQVDALRAVLHRVQRRRRSA
jgi:hypothetical protein